MQEFGENEKIVRGRFDADVVYKNFRDNPIVFLANEQIYEIFERFWNENCSNLLPSVNPSLFIVGAQPGAGKTGLVNKIGIERKVLSLIGDVYRSLHPNIRIIVDNPDYSRFTGPLNGVINLLVISRCIDRKISFVFETTMGNLESTERSMEMAYNGGYSLNINMLIVKKSDSFLGTYYRAARMIENHATSRFSISAFHDKAYNGILDFLSHKESISKLNSLVLFNRNLEPIFEAHDISPANVNVVCLRARDDVVRERGRPHTREEAEELERQKAFVLDYIDRGLITVVSRDSFLREYESRAEAQELNKSC